MACAVSASSQSSPPPPYALMPSLAVAPEWFHPARLPKEPVVSGVGHALSPNASNRAGLGGATSRDDAVHTRHALGAPRAVVVQLQPLHGAGVDDPLVRRRGGVEPRDLADSRLEPDSAEVKDGDTGSVEEVVAEELDGREALRPLQVGRGREGIGGVGAVLGARELVERDGGLAEDGGGRAVPGGLAEAGLLGARVEEGGVVEDGDSAGCCEA